MQREIKFRVFYKEKMHPVFSIQQQKNGAVAYYKIPKDISIIKAEGGEIMQFTGLKDSTGREIFEGDIVETSSREIGVIVWQDAGFYIKFSRNHYFAPRISDQDNLLIKGNIYENPELLKK